MIYNRCIPVCYMQHRALCSVNTNLAINWPFFSFVTLWDCIEQIFITESVAEEGPRCPLCRVIFNSIPTNIHRPTRAMVIATADTEEARVARAWENTVDSIVPRAIDRAGSEYRWTRAYIDIVLPALGYHHHRLDQLTGEETDRLCDVMYRIHEVTGGARPNIFGSIQDLNRGMFVSPGWVLGIFTHLLTSPYPPSTLLPGISRVVCCTRRSYAEALCCVNYVVSTQS